MNEGKQPQLGDIYTCIVRDIPLQTSPGKQPLARVIEHPDFEGFVVIVQSRAPADLQVGDVIRLKLRGFSRSGRAGFAEFVDRVN